MLNHYSTERSSGVCMMRKKIVFYHEVEIIILQSMRTFYIYLFNMVYYNHYGGIYHALSITSYSFQTVVARKLKFAYSARSFGNIILQTRDRERGSRWWKNCVDAQIYCLVGYFYFWDIINPLVIFFFNECTFFVL